MQETQHFAWLAAPAAFNPVTHAVFDEPWKSLTIEGAEGQAAVAQVEIVNPGQGLLAPGRDLYAHVSLTRNGNTHHLFAGRVVGAPGGISGDFLTLTLDARFGDLEAVIAAAVAPYKVTPGYDTLFIDPNRVDEPMEVLEGYHAHLFVDPLNQAIRVSDALFGSAVSTTPVTPGLGAKTIQVPPGLAFAHGVRVRVWYKGDFTQHFTGPITAFGGSPDTEMTVTADAYHGAVERSDWVISLDVTEDKIDGESVNVNVTHKPYTAVRAVVEAQWSQKATGDISVTEAIKSAADSPTIRTLNYPEDFAETWPEPGTAINGSSGYTVKSASLTKQPSVEYTSEILVGWGTFKTFGINTYTPELTLSYDMEQKRVEKASFTLTGNAQDVIADLSQIEPLDFHLQDVGPELTSPAHGSFFITDRGRAALNHGMQLARVALAESQRCVEIPFTMPGWPLEALYLTCDHTVCLHSPKLPGGVAIGKVSDYSKVMNEDGRSCAVTMKCSVGKGYTLAGAGSPSDDYVDEGYIDDGYYGEGGAVINTGGPTPLAYETFYDQAPTDPLVAIATWSENDFLQNLTIGPLHEAQLTYLNQHAFLGPLSGADGTNPHRPEDTLRDKVPTKLELELASLASTDELAHNFDVVMVGNYGIPKTIDLEAA